MGNEVENYAYAYDGVAFHNITVGEEGFICANSSEYILVSGDEQEIVNDDFFQIKTKDSRPEVLLSDKQKAIRDDYFLILQQIVQSEASILKMEGVEVPSETAINLSKELITELAFENIYPIRIGTSIEEGICMTFGNRSDILYFEIYNDGDLGYLIEDPKSKKVLKNEDVFSISQARMDIVDFFKSICVFQTV